MNKLILLGVLLCGTAFSQIRSFDGGGLNFDLENTLTPFGASVSGDLAGISSNFEGAAALFNNPTGLMRRSGMYLDLDTSLPGLSSEHSSKGPLGEAVSEGLDGAFEDTPKKNIKDPQVNLGIQEPMDVRGLSLFRSDSVHGHKFHYGIGYAQTQNLAIQSDLQGMAVEIASATDETDAASDTLYALIRGMFSLDFQWTLKEYSGALAYKAPNVPVIFGLGLKYYRFNYRMNTFFRGDGYLARNGLTYGFYSPGVNYPDSLYANYSGMGKGGAGGVNLAVTWEANDWLNTGLYFDYAGTIDAEGGLSGYGYNLFGLDPSSGELSMSQMNLTKLTLTQRHEYELDKMTLQLPSKVGLSVSGFWKSTNIKTNLSYAYYYRDMKWQWDYTHRKTKIDSTKEIIKTEEGQDSLFVSHSQYGFTLKKAQLVNVGFDFDGWHWNLGAMFWEKTGVIHKNYTSTWDLPNVYPLFSFGWRSWLGNHLELDISLITLPESLFKTSVRYQF